MRGILLRFVAALLAVAPVAPANAAQIIYTFTGDAVGVLGPDVLNGQFTLTGVGNTDDAIFNSPFSPTSTIIPLSSFTISFGGADYLGTATTVFFVNPAANVAGFNAFYPPATVRSITGFGLSGYDGLSNFSATTPGFAFTNLTINQPLPNTYQTSGGDFIFTGPIRPISFSAALVGGVPEPTTWMIFILGFFFIGSAIRMRNGKLSRIPAAA